MKSTRDRLRGKLHSCACLRFHLPDTAPILLVFERVQPRKY